jgi:hypothetical protein
VLAKAGLTLADIDVFEYHEALNFQMECWISIVPLSKNVSGDHARHSICENLFIENRWME